MVDVELLLVVELKLWSASEGGNLASLVIHYHCQWHYHSYSYSVKIDICWKFQQRIIHLGLKTSENSWEHWKTSKIIWYHPENNWGPIIDNLVQFEEDFNSRTKMLQGLDRLWQTSPIPRSPDGDKNNPFSDHCCQGKQGNKELFSRQGVCLSQYMFWLDCSVLEHTFCYW